MTNLKLAFLDSNFVENLVWLISNRVPDWQYLAIMEHLKTTHSLDHENVRSVISKHTSEVQCDSMTEHYDAIVADYERGTLRRVPEFEALDEEDAENGGQPAPWT